MSDVIARWLPIAQADKSITEVQDFPSIELTLRNSERYWVRDADGRVFEASWTEGERNYWWDWEGESPVDPIQFMPHPLDPRWSPTLGPSRPQEVQAKTGRLLELMQDRPTDRASLTYRNWRGETSVRELHLVRIWYGSTKWHPEPQLLLHAFDYQKDAYRDFAVADFHFDDSTPTNTKGSPDAQ